MATPTPLPRGSVIGIFGGGQLGRMAALAAAPLGYRCHVFCPDPHSPAFQVANAFTCAPYTDLQAVKTFADSVDLGILEALTPAFRDSFIARYQERHPLSGPPTLQSGFATLLPRAPYPGHLPAFADIVAGADATIWVQRSGLLEGLPGDQTLQWSVLDAEGAWLGDLTVPAGFRPTDVGRDWVLGLRNVDGGGVRVQLLPIVPR